MAHLEGRRQKSGQNGAPQRQHQEQDVPPNWTEVLEENLSGRQQVEGAGEISFKY